MSDFSGGLTNAEDGTASEPGASGRGQSLSLAVDSVHPHTGSASAGGASGVASLTLGQVTPSPVYLVSLN